MGITNVSNQSICPAKHWEVTRQSIYLFPIIYHSHKSFLETVLLLILNVVSDPVPTPLRPAKGRNDRFHITEPVDLIIPFLQFPRCEGVVAQCQ